MKILSRIIVCVCIVLNCTTPLYAGLKEPTEGYTVLKSIFFAPAAFIQFFVFDVPRGILSPFKRSSSFEKKYAKSLKNTDWQKRALVVERLSKESDPMRYNYLVEALSDHQIIVALKARDILMDTSDPALRTLLLKTLESRDPLLRVFAAEILAKHNDPEVIKQLVFLANDYNREVKIAALTALENISQEPLLLKYYPYEMNATSNNSITHWWYMRGKAIKASELE